MKGTLLSVIAMLFCYSAIAQKICFTPEVVSQKRATDPNYDEQMKVQEDALRKWVNTHQEDPYFSARAVRTIPIVFHVVYNTAAQNISDAVLQQMVDQLNLDYRKLNPDFATARSVVQALAADAQIQFCLAQKKPDGSATNGIEHIQTTKSCFDRNSEPNAMKSASTGGANTWDPYRYLNVWVVYICGNTSQSGVGGYAYIPAAGNGLHGSNVDGIVLDYRLGIGTVRALTHEIGHYLGLHHTWGDLSSNACGNVFPATDDGFSDTPDSKAPNFLCNIHTSCTNNSTYGDQYENFMDYADNCDVLFTTQQANYMNNVLTNIRGTLVNNNNKCTATGIQANFAGSPATVCTGQTVQFTNTSIGSNLTYSWSFPGGTPPTSTAQNPTVTYSAAGAYNVSLTVTSGALTSTKTETAYISVSGSNALPLAEGFESTTFPPAGWSLNNVDNSTTWVRTTSASGFGASGASAYVNNYNYNAPGAKDWLITPSYNFTGITAGRIKWDYAYAQYPQSGLTDSLTVLCSTNCGLTWTTLWSRGGSSLATANATSNNFNPNASQWKRDSVSLASLNGQANVRFAFLNTNKYGNNIFIDNINIYNSAGQVAQAPVADFVGTPTTIIAGSTVSFTDLSTNTPTSWNWTFAGGTPGASTVQNPVVTYNTPGIYAVTLTATNGTGGNTATKASYIIVVQQGGGSSVCDTLSNFTPNDTLAIYNFIAGTGQSGYVTGHNSFGDLAKAEFYQNSTSGAQVTGGIFLFGVAKTNNPATSTVAIKVWAADGVNGAPGTELASQNVLISTIAQNVAASQFTVVTFNTPATVTGNFYIGVRFTYLAGDTVAIFTNRFTSTHTNYGWELWNNNTWHRFDSVSIYPKGLDLFALPILCTVSQGIPPVASFTANNTAICAGTTVTFNSTSTGSPTSFSWSFPGAVQTISTAQTPAVTYNTPGTYNVSLTVSNGNGNNTATQNAYITVYEKPVLTPATVPVNCFGGSTGSATVNVTGGTTPYTYNWAGGGNTATIGNKLAGSYNVTVGDAHQCSVTASVNIGQPLAPLTLTPQPSNPFCGLQNGIASVDATGGAGGYTYLWDDNAVLQTKNNLAAGTYIVTVTDANNCTATTFMQLTNQVIQVNADVDVVDASCSQNNGSASASVINSSVGISGYVWNTGATTGIIQNLAPGAYTVTITLANGCTASSSGTVGSSSTGITVNFNITEAGCGSTNGAATANPSGGTSPYTYSWGTGSVNPGISGVAAAGYGVTVSDAAGCTIATVANISNTGAPVLSTTFNNPLCYGASSGSATVSVSGGLPPYNYMWSSGANGVTAPNLAAGVYVISVVDGAQCVAVKTVSLTGPPQITVNVTTVNATCGYGNGSATAAAVGGTGTLTYQWDNGAILANNPNIAAGNYLVVVSDANACTVTATAQVTGVAGPTTVLNPVNGTCQAGAQINVDVNGGTSPFTYLWSNGATSQNIANIPAGIYTATVTDANGCTSINSGTVTDNSTIGLAFATQNPAQGNNGSVTATPSGGAAPYTYAWSNGGNTETISNLAAGTYTVTVTDQAGCVKISGVTIGFTSVPQINAASINVYPNPTGSLCNINIALAKPQNVSIEILNTLGQAVWDKQLGEYLSGIERIDMSGHAQGIYIVRIKVDGNIKTVRLVKE